MRRRDAARLRRGPIKTPAPARGRGAHFSAPDSAQKFAPPARLRAIFPPKTCSFFSPLLDADSYCIRRVSRPPFTLFSPSASSLSSSSVLPVVPKELHPCGHPHPLPFGRWP